MGKLLFLRKNHRYQVFSIDYTYPFETVGFDYAGPIFHKFKNDRNVEMKKCYFLLITCTSTHAVHLEVTTDVNTNSLLFKFNNVKWKFILERSPWCRAGRGGIL